MDTELIFMSLGFFLFGVIVMEIGFCLLGASPCKRLEKYEFDRDAVERAVNNVMERSGQKNLGTSVVLRDRSEINRDYIRKHMINGFKMYLTLVIKNKGKRVMMTSDAVDELWHELFKDEKKYKEMCEYILGFYLDYVPENKEKVNPIRSIGKLNVRALNSEFLETTRMIRDEYGTLAVPLLMLDNEIENRLGFDYNLKKLGNILDLKKEEQKISRCN